MCITQKTKDHIFTHLANLDLVQKKVKKKSEKTIEKQTFRVFQLKEGWTETKLIINKDYYHEQLHSNPSQWAFVLFERCCRLK